jgi:hypothetical protein
MFGKHHDGGDEDGDEDLLERHAHLRLAGLGGVSPRGVGAPSQHGGDAGRAAKNEEVARRYDRRAARDAKRAAKAVAS